MLAKIQSLFKNETQEEVVPLEYKLQLASAVLLLEIAKADFDKDPEEEAAIRASLQSQFSLTAEDLDALFEEATSKGEEVISLHSFVRTINENCSEDEKELLMEQMWLVAYADGRLDKYEDYNIRKIADLLYMKHQQFIQSKQRAKAKLGQA